MYMCRDCGDQRQQQQNPFRHYLNGCVYNTHTHIAAIFVCKCFAKLWSHLLTHTTKQANTHFEMKTKRSRTLVELNCERLKPKLLGPENNDTKTLLANNHFHAHPRFLIVAHTHVNERYSVVFGDTDSVSSASIFVAHLRAYSSYEHNSHTHTKHTHKKHNIMRNQADKRNAKTLCRILV